MQMGENERKIRPAPDSLCTRRALCYQTVGMSRFFSRNIGFYGRLARGVIGTFALIAGIIMADFQLWICLTLVGIGLFCIFEAVRGWCLARACGIRTKM